MASTGDGFESCTHCDSLVREIVEIKHPLYLGDPDVPSIEAAIADPEESLPICIALTTSSSHALQTMILRFWRQFAKSHHLEQSVCRFHLSTETGHLLFLGITV